MAKGGTPAWFLSKSEESIEKKQVDFFVVQKSAQECEKKGDRSMTGRGGRRGEHEDGDKSRACDYGLPRERDGDRSLVSNAARRGESCSVTAVNWNPRPLPDSKCRTIASVRIWPSWTRKSSLALVPTGRGLLGAARNRPPALRSRTRETSSLPLQRQ